MSSNQRLGHHRPSEGQTRYVQTNGGTQASIDRNSSPNLTNPPLPASNRLVTNEPSAQPNALALVRPRQSQSNTTNQSGAIEAQPASHTEQPSDKALALRLASFIVSPSDIDSNSQIYRDFVAEAEYLFSAIEPQHLQLLVNNFLPYSYRETLYIEQNPLGVANQALEHARFLGSLHYERLLSHLIESPQEALRLWESFWA